MRLLVTDHAVEIRDHTGAIIFADTRANAEADLAQIIDAPLVPVGAAGLEYNDSAKHIVYFDADGRALSLNDGTAAFAQQTFLLNLPHLLERQQYRFLDEALRARSRSNARAAALRALGDDLRALPEGQRAILQRVVDLMKE